MDRYCYIISLLKSMVLATLLHVLIPGSDLFTGSVMKIIVVNLKEQTVYDIFQESLVQPEREFHI